MPTPSGSQYDVFLSHSSIDKPIVEELARRLKQAGIEPFLDKWNLIPGDPWQEALEAALINSAACAVFVGAGGFSPWQNEELRAAIEHRVSGSRGGYRVIPVLLPGALKPDPAGRPRFLLRGTWVLFSQSLDDEQAFHALVCGIRGIAPGPGPGQAIFEGECPYRGLEVFEEKHARFFFGREAQVDWLLSHRLAPMAESSHARRFLEIMGPSGSGKSSLALAGLIPALKAGKVEGSAGWPIIVFRPGPNPLESLAIELSRAGLTKSSAAAIQGLMTSLLHDRTTLHLTARLALKAPATRFVVLADQFEEIFTLCNDEALRRALIENLLHAATVVGGPVVVLLTMRVDFLGKCAADHDLAAALSDGQELVGPMSKDELRLAIERPADLAGCTLEQGLTDLLLQDVQGQAGALPLLEYTLLELWRERLGKRLTIAAYNGMGKVQGALEHRADAVLDGFRSRPGELEICRRIFLRLTQPGEGTEDTKRRAAFDELIASEVERPAVEEVVRKLADARLITTEGREGTARAGEQPGPTEDRKRPTQQPGEGLASGYVEVAHEALIRGWKQLRQWIDADRAGLRTHRQLTEAARDWQEHKRDESYLYVGSRLAVAREWSESHAPDLNPLEWEFLDASFALRRRREAEELETARRLAAEAQAREEAERKQAEAIDQAWQDFSRPAAHRVGTEVRIIETEAILYIKRELDQAKAAPGGQLAVRGDVIRNALQVIQNAVERLRLTAKDYQRLSVGPEASEEFDICDLIDSTIQSTRVGFKGIKVLTQYRDRPMRISAYQDMITCIFEELLINAWKTKQVDSEEGDKIGVCIELRREQDSVICTVSDNGPGIPPMLISTLFQKPVQGRPGGTGLGLYTCMQLLGENGGTIDLLTEGKPAGYDGACFRITLPLEGSRRSERNAPGCE